MNIAEMETCLDELSEKTDFSFIVEKEPDIYLYMDGYNPEGED